MNQMIVKGMVETGRKLAGLEKQTRFASMQAINDCAKAVQQFEIERQLPSKLTLRSRGSPWWKPGSRFGVNIRPFATRDRLSATVGSQAPWLALQETGGTKTASGHRLAIEAGARPNERAVIPAAVKPRALLRTKGQVYNRRGKAVTARSSGKGFEINTRSGPAIYVNKNGTLHLMYHLRSSARIPARLNFFGSAKALVESTYQTTFDARLKAALATAK